MCLDLFTKEAPGGSILVSDHLPQATTQSLHFGWSLTGGSTVFSSIHLFLPIAISGLWLGSLYISGLSLWRKAAWTLFGCAWIDNALLTDNTFNKNGSLLSNASLTASPRTSLFDSIHSDNKISFPLPSTVDGPFGCVPIQNCKENE